MTRKEIVAGFAVLEQRKHFISQKVYLREVKDKLNQLSALVANRETENPLIDKYGLLTKFVRSRWLDIDQVLFLRVYGPRRSRGP